MATPEGQTWDWEVPRGRLRVPEARARIAAWRAARSFRVAPPRLGAPRTRGITSSTSCTPLFQFTLIHTLLVTLWRLSIDPPEMLFHSNLPQLQDYVSVKLIWEHQLV